MSASARNPLEISTWSMKEFLLSQKNERSCKDKIASFEFDGDYSTGPTKTVCAFCTSMAIHEIICTLDGFGENIKK